MFNFFSVAVACLAAVVAIWVALRVQSVGAVVSMICDRLLRARYPIVHSQSGRPLPSLPFIFPNGQGNVEKFLNGRHNSVEWSKEYGPIYRLWSGLSSEIVLTDPKHIEAVFRDSHKHVKAPDNNSGYLMHQLLGECVGLISKTPWKTLRTATEGPFVRSATLNYTDFLLSRTRDFLSQLHRDSKTTGSSYLLDPVADVKLLPFLCVAQLIYGKLSPRLEQRLLDMIALRESVFHNVIQGGITRFKFARYLPLRANRDLDKFKLLWSDFNDEAAAAAAAGNEDETDTEKIRSEPAPIKAMYASVGQDQITREELLQTLDEMLFANLDVTMGGISWNIVFLAAHKPAQMTLRREIQAAFTSSDPQTAVDSLLVHTSNYLTACMLESSRLRPLAAFSVPQSCPTPRILAGYTIPAGTNFIVDSHALNLRNPFWGPDLATYRPDRFLERATKSDARYHYWRFGFGPRQCMGRYVADMMIKCLLVELVSNYELQLVNPTGDSEKPAHSDQDEWEFDKETWIHHPQMRVRCTRLGDWQKK